MVRTAAEQALYEQKTELAKEYAAVRAGTLDEATHEADRDALVTEVGVKASARRAAVTSSSDNLSLAVKSQKKDYYCGPAAGRRNHPGARPRAPQGRAPCSKDPGRCRG